ncbi:hypothetical protein AX17_002236 [Amanita inopinata Kibby_2008]|nr:hypothetical protein AX17_002236 [Amanita inopinata Kibby_2008]
MRSSSYERLPNESELNEARQIMQSSHYTEDLGLGDDLGSYQVRPPTYYGEGPFDPPSSEDEGESLLEKEVNEPQSPGRAERGDAELDWRNRPEKRSSSLRALLYSLVALVSLAGVIGIIAATSYPGSSLRGTGFKRITMDHIFNGTFLPDAYRLHWVPEAGDGVFSILQDGYIKLVDLKTNSTKNLVARQDVKDENGQPLLWMKWQLSADMKYILLKAHERKQWRWSSFGNYYVHHIETKKTHPIIPPTNPPVTSYATWSPTGKSIAYVADNDLYIKPSASPSTSPIRITTSGNASLFHGVPDWVYEEEIFSGDYALWWSPDSSKIAFLAFDETLVDEYKFPVYNPTGNANEVVPYTNDVVMKYPKPGYNNPLVSVHIFDLARYLANDTAIANGFPAANSTLTLDWEKRQKPDNSVILEVAWVDNSTLLVKEVNRNADEGSVILFNLDAVDEESRSHGRVVRRLGKAGEEGDEGWIDNKQTIYPLPSSLSIADSNAYLDVVPTSEGYNHIALFSPAGSSSPQFLTSGKWEVTSGIKAIDSERRIVYFEAAHPSSIERHLYSVPLPSNNSSGLVEPAALTDVTKPSYYSADFSPQAGFYLLNYHGPSIPWQKVVQVNDTAFQYVLTTNERLLNASRQYEVATVLHSTILSDGYELNVKEIRPPRMDDSGRTKYPVLFRVYGGPQSQLVDLKFNRDWHDFLVCGLQYIVVIVDGRGTGFKGRKLRNPVKGNLGYWETIDQINAAKVWASRGYTDPKRIGIWGWSYGGFMSSKVVEANAGIHSLAMAIAPVTSWRLYDSIYTERYMNLPDLNPGGYVNASISNVTGFQHVEYLLAHGSADDNVHFANSAHLLDMLTEAQVRSFRFRMFTDSDHSITRRGAQREVYEYMTRFLTERWGKGGRRRGCHPTSEISLNVLPMSFPVSLTFPPSVDPVMVGPPNIPKAFKERPRGLWKARVTAARASANNIPDRKEKSPRPISDIDDDSPKTPSSLSSHPPRPVKKQRTDSSSDSYSSSSDEEEGVYYWDFSRRCSRHRDRVSKWTTRAKIMDTSSTASRGMSQDERMTCDLDDWDDLKELFAKAAEQYEGDDASETIPLLRGVIHECHRFLIFYPDPSVLFSNQPSQPELFLFPKEKYTLPSSEQILNVVQTPSSKIGEQSARRERKCKCVELPTAFHAILGTALFLFGNLIAQDPSLALEGEPTVPTSYWLAALDVFETGENLPSRTSGMKQCDAPEDWRMAVVWGRTLVCLADELVSRQIQAKQEGIDLSTVGLDISEPQWPPESPFFTIAAQRQPITRRMSFNTATPNDLLVLAMDQFSRGIFHMPHPQYHLAQTVAPSGSSNSQSSSSFRSLSSSSPSNPTLTSAVQAVPNQGYFSRAKELYTIASEVLLVAEKLENPPEREYWARWADSVFNQMKMEADKDSWRQLILRSRGRCWLVVGSATVEEIEAALERGEMNVLKSEDAIDAREGLAMAISFYERAKGSARDAETGDVISVEDADAEADDLQPLLTEALLTLANLTEDSKEREELYARAKVEAGMDLDFELDADEDMVDATS